MGVETERLVMDVLTNRYNNSRTGSLMGEETLTSTSISSESFGRLFVLAVDGAVYAQPLYLQGLAIGGKTRNVIFAATMHNSLYAFDADDGGPPLWHINLGQSFPTSGPNEVDYSGLWQYSGAQQDPSQDGGRPGEIGILSTPAIDRNKGQIYVVAYILDPGGDPSVYSRNNKASFFIHSIELQSGRILARSKIAATSPGWVKGQPRAIQFDSTTLNQRPGLLIANSRVYTGFASLYGDQRGYHGWVLGFTQENLALECAFTAAPDTDDISAQGVGKWQAGHGIASDNQGNLYVLTGNGKISPGRNYPISVLKLTYDLHLADWFTPYNLSDLNQADEDLGSPPDLC